jgi:hypothetical protein
MFQGVESHDRLSIVHNVQILAKAAGVLAYLSYPLCFLLWQKQAGAIPVTSLQVCFELQQDWARGETYEGVMDILRAHSPYGFQVRFSKWALGEHASEGTK